MKLAILHLSDAHIKKEKTNNSLFEKEEAIFNAIKNEITHCSNLFIVFTGDIAFTGHKDEYTIANIFFHNISKFLSEYNHSIKINFVFAPGNHDCNFSIGQTVRDIVIKSILEHPSQIDQHVIDICTESQKDYFEFIETFHSEKNINQNISNKLLIRYEFKIDNYSISFNSFNTAWMSQKQEQQAKILFPLNAINQEKIVESQDDLTISIFHHPQHWLTHSNLRNFKEFVDSCSDVVLTGHEHTQSASQTHNISSHKNVEYIEGGTLQDSHDATHSKFNLLLIDLQTKKHDIFIFEWHKSIYNKIANEGIELPLCNKSLFQLNELYSKKISSLPLKLNHPRKENIILEDIYIYPDLRTLEIHNNNKTANAFNKISSRDLLKESPIKKVIIFGKDNAGKTSLAHMLQIKFKEKGLIPLVINGKEIKKINNDKIIENTLTKAFKEQYEIKKNELTTFQQEDKKNIVIIFDDLQYIKFNNQTKGEFIEKFEKLGYTQIIVFSDAELEFEATSESNLAKSLQNFSYYHILEFGHVLRDDLIRKWIILGQERELENDEIAAIRRTKAHAITHTLGLNFIPSYPFYLLTLLQAMEANDTTVDKSSYGHYYQYMIMQYLTNYGEPLENKDLNTIFGYLSMLAFKMFSEKKYILDQIELDEYDLSYKKYIGYTPKLNLQKKILQSHLLVESDYEYKFSHKYLYYYFVAYYFSQNVDDEGITTIIDNMTQRLYRAEFANILMFIFHLSPKKDILGMLNREAKKIFADLEEFSFTQNELLTINNSIHENMTSKLEDRTFEESRRIELEQEEKKDAFIHANHIDDQRDASHNEEIQNLDIFGQINLACKLIDILGEVVKNYAGTLKYEPIYELIQNTYGMGLRSLKRIFIDVEENHELIVRELQNLIDKKGFVTTDKKDDAINKFVFNLATSVATGFIKRISQAIGDPELKSIYNKISKEDPNNIAYKLIEQSINLNFNGGLNSRKIIELYDYLDKEKNSLTSTTLKHLVMAHLYKFDVSADKKMSICRQLDITISPKTEYSKKVGLKT
ncbi:metallophosphoesterase [Sulfurospirillum sp. UCH001]|uniref:metallophosphoesterase n=1 Tax=Sulfurospirillum sp. UCH001 TaxID=1581011 RepID=UPI00082AF653|nr:metallophosphoesterase [Sulfurospirillum sp. UCH001]